MASRRERKLLARIRTLEAALQPFAAEAGTWLDTVSNRYRPGITEPKKREFYSRAEYNIGHLRRAARLVAGQP